MIRSLGFAVQPVGRVGALPGWGDGLNREGQRDLSRRDQMHAAGVADLRRDHCIDGPILDGSKRPLTPQAGDARGCSVPGPDQGPRAPFRARTPALNRMPRSASHFGENDRPFGYRSKSLSISSYQLALS